MKIKKTFAFIIGVILILCTISSCGSSEASPVGKWYNEKGKCLDIRADGSWKLEDSYGTGTWKKLDDNTFEFSDYYGDVQESAINEDELGQYIDFGYYGDFYKESQNNSADSEKIEESSTVVFNSINDFNNGVAWITYTKTDSNEEMFCLIDTTGKKLYEDHYNNFVLNDFNGGVSYINNYGKYVFLNESGKVITTSEEIDFDKIVGYGDGVFLLYKNQSSISESKHIYTVIDKNGKQLCAPIDLGCEPDDESAYVGCGIFVIRGEAYDKVLFNYKTQKKTFISTKTASSSINFINDKALFSNNVYVSDTGDFSLDLYESCHVLNTNFELKEIDFFNYETDGVAVQCYDCEYVSMTDINTENKIEITQYPVSRTSGTITFNGDYGTIRIIGADNKIYYSLIDRQANFQFEPICCTYASFADGYMVFKNENDTWGIADKDGNVLANNLDYREINNFDNGIAIASDSQRERFYINTKGERIQIDLN